MKLFLARNPFGRALLHTGCLCRGGNFHFHRAGIIREMRQLSRLLVPRYRQLNPKKVLRKRQR